MTVLIVVPMVLIVGSAVALGFGWVSANESLIWASISATVIAAVLLALAYYRSIKIARTPLTAADMPTEGVSEDPETDPLEGTAAEGAEAAEAAEERSQGAQGAHEGSTVNR